MKEKLVILDDGAPVFEGHTSVGMFYGFNGTGVLIECGPSIPDALARCGIDVLSVTDLFVSHGDRDHTRGFKDLLNDMAAAAEGERISHQLRLWGPNLTVNELTELAMTTRALKSSRKKGGGPLTISSGNRDDRFRLFRVDHNSVPCCGLFLKLGRQRILYFGDTGNKTHYNKIVGSFPNPTVMVLEANNGMGESTLRHIGYRQARKVFDLVPVDGKNLVKIIWHVRHDREKVAKRASNDGIIFAERELSISLGG